MEDSFIPLKEIIRNSPVPSDVLVLTSSADVLDFSEQTEIQKTDEDVATNTFNQDVLNELFLDTKFFFKQCLNLDMIKERTGVDNAIKIRRRLNRLIEAFEENLKRNKLTFSFLEQKLESNTYETSRTAALILCSVEPEQTDSPYLNRVFKSLSKRVENDKSPIAEALQYGKQSEISSKLRFMTEISKPEIERLCREIIHLRDPSLF